MKNLISISRNILFQRNKQIILKSHLLKKVRHKPSSVVTIVSLSMSSAEVSPVLITEDFTETLSLKALKVPNNECHMALKAFEKFALIRPRIKTIRKDSKFPNHRFLLLENFENLGPSQDLVEMAKAKEYEIIDYLLKLSYEDMSAEKVLKKILPEDVEAPTAFEAIGHIAHLNLRPQHEPYKNIIGKVILDKNPHLKTVVNKIGEIDNAFRIPNIEVIAGEPNLVALVKQSGYRYKVDYSKVYWNSRLEAEHERLVNLFSPNDIIWDAMAGVGPFAIPAAHKGCKVYANDLNESSYEYLNINMRLNKIIPFRFRTFKMDAREFLRYMISLNPLYVDKEDIKNDKDKDININNEREKRTHIIMNYPSGAIDFLDVFCKNFDRGVWAKLRLPIVHCYSFYKGENELELVEKCEAVLGGKISNATLHKVRDVSPGKLMYCITFNIPEPIAFE